MSTFRKVLAYMLHKIALITLALLTILSRGLFAILMVNLGLFITRYYYDVTGQVTRSSYFSMANVMRSIACVVSGISAIIFQSPLIFIIAVIELYSINANGYLNVSANKIPIL